ncbi:hypothetical protein B566_EDAN001442 [Ephemera danica]|nr:hypothetical protein B566_EDAN001442 [Ephemera danica]
MFSGEIRRRDSPERPIVTSQSLVTGTTFSYTDVLHELIIYVPSFDLNEDTMDSSVFSVTDGEFVTQASLGFRVLATRRDAPSSSLLAPETVQLRVSAGGMRDVSPAELGTRLTGQGRRLVLVSPPPQGLQMQVKRRGEVGWAALQPGQPFTREEVSQGGIRLVHNGALRATFPVRLRVEERNGNQIGDLVLMADVRDNVAPPVIEVNNLLVNSRNTSSVITTQSLSASDLDSQASELIFTVVTRPKWGRLELRRNGLQHEVKTVNSWSQIDLEEGHLSYINHAPNEATRDGFQFTLSDGSTSMRSKVGPSSDLPMVSEVRPVTVMTGSRATVSQFELQVDSSRPEYLSFNIAVAPRLGTVQLRSGDDSYSPTSSFSMLDVAEGRVTYLHEAAQHQDDYDEILLLLSCRGRPCEYSSPTSATPVDAPITLPIHIRLPENGSPIIRINNGIRYLERDANGKTVGFLSKNLLDVIDDDSSPRRIVFTVTQPPSFGLLYKIDAPATPISVFTQDDLDASRVFYQLDNENDYSATHDHFKFEVSGSKSKTLTENNFYIQWSWISIAQTSYTIYETDGILRVKLWREGGVARHSSTVRCRLVPEGGSATWGANKSANNDIELQFGLVQFDSYEKEKYCSLKIYNDNIYEGLEDFIIEIYESSKTLLGLTTRSHITLLDPEDQPTITFKSNLRYVNETDGPITIDVYRSGDVRDSSSVTCSTQAGSARGSDSLGLSHADFVARQAHDASSVITFAPGEDSAKCIVQLIDDAIFEDTEDFTVILSNPDSKSVLGASTKLRVFIEGPNDVSQVYFSQGDHYVLENAGEVDVAVTRTGTDLSHNSSVWCTTQAISAVPKIDYIPMSQQVHFGRSDIEAWCRLTILDDSAVPQLEGPLRLRLILTSPEGATLLDPSRTNVVIDDTPTDTPTLEFAHSVLSVRENEGTLRAPVLRTGDLRHVASVKCYTRQRSARAGHDFEDRMKAETSRIDFAMGQALNYCEVNILDDPVLEGEEDFVLRLAEPLFEELDTGQEKLALIGDKAMMRVKITDDEDTPKIYFEKREVTVNESTNEPHVLKIKVLRAGDTSSVAKVHVTSRDGSAISGADYVAVSSLLTFDPGVESREVKVTVLPGDEEEGRREESFFLVLDGGEPGDSSTLVVTIRSSAEGALVLPAQPVVTSLMHYDNVSDENPDPGYPLVCISPCEERYPHISRTKELCGALKYKTIQYFWEVAVPSGLQTIRHMPFKKLTTSTFFAKVDSKVLDSIYFTSNFQVRCGVQPIKVNGRLGIPIKSPVVTIGKSRQFCKKTYNVDSVRDHAFSANVQYINETSESHPNTVHIKLEVPHSDGMVPLVSTHPLHNVRSLLTDPLYSAHHACSNLLTEKGFLATPATLSRGLRPHELDEALRGVEAVRLYRHLDLRTCLWTFDAWFHMSQLVDDCHGKVVSEFKLAEGGAGELSVEVPLHVAYVAARGAQEWAAVEHRTTLHVNVRYSALLWHPGLLTESKRGAATVQVSRVSANEAGQLVVEFWTEALFRGRFVSWHPSAPRLQSAMAAPRGLTGLGMNLELVWSEPTWDGPRQLWRAVSNASLTDFSGQYSAMLLPCVAAPTTVYTDAEPPRCHAHQPSRIPLNIAFQVPTRPEPAKYALHTQFDLTNNPKEFLADPADPQHFRSGDAPWRFSTGEKVLGRVSWHPGQDLSSAYRLQIERVLLCAGREGITENMETQRLGCLQPSPALAHRFVLLDRERPDTEDKEVRGVQFQARFARDVPEFRPKLETLPGVDGFIWLVDPLYQVGSGQQWFLQVLYRIRATSASERHKRENEEWHRGTAMRTLVLAEPPHVTNVPPQASWHQKLLTPPMLAIVLAPLVLVALGLVTWRVLRRCGTSYTPATATSS